MRILYILLITLLAAFLPAACKRDDDKKVEKPTSPTTDRRVIQNVPESAPEGERPRDDKNQGIEPTRAGDLTAAPDPAIGEIEGFIAEKAIDTSNPTWKTKLPMPPKLAFDANSTYTWSLATNKGEIRIKLKPEVAPMHVSSTIYLTKLGFYDGTTFHRVIKGFMAQGGDPLGNGRGGPGYSYGSEIDVAINKHDRPGLLSMANLSRPNTDGSQFFLTFAPTPDLDNGHTIFGEVVDGMDTLRAMEAVGAEGDGPPRERLVIEKATITVESPTSR